MDIENEEPPPEAKKLASLVVLRRLRSVIRKASQGESVYDDMVARIVARREREIDSLVNDAVKGL